MPDSLGRIDDARRQPSSARTSAVSHHDLEVQPPALAHFSSQVSVHGRAAGRMAAVAAGLPLPSERRKRRDRTRWGASEEDGDPDGSAPSLPTLLSAPAPPAADASIAASDQPRRPKRSRWASEDPDVKAIVPGLAVPVSLPASLAGLVDAHPQAMLLHRQLGVVCTFTARIQCAGYVENVSMSPPGLLVRYNQPGWFHR